MVPHTTERRICLPPPARSGHETSYRYVTFASSSAAGGSLCCGVGRCEGRKCGGERAERQAAPTLRLIAPLLSKAFGRRCVTASTIRVTDGLTGRLFETDSPDVQRVTFPDFVARVINAMLSELHASHTHFYTRDEPEYYQLADIFVGALRRRGLERAFPDGRISYPGIGIISASEANVATRSRRSSMEP